MSTKLRVFLPSSCLGKTCLHWVSQALVQRSRNSGKLDRSLCLYWCLHWCVHVFNLIKSKHHAGLFLTLSLFLNISNFKISNFEQLRCLIMATALTRKTLLHKILDFLFRRSQYFSISHTCVLFHLLLFSNIFYLTRLPSSEELAVQSRRINFWQIKTFSSFTVFVFIYYHNFLFHIFPCLKQCSTLPLQKTSQKAQLCFQVNTNLRLPLKARLFTRKYFEWIVIQLLYYENTKEQRFCNGKSEEGGRKWWELLHKYLYNLIWVKISVLFVT